MEEQKISYSNNSDIQRIISELNSIEFLLVEHKPREKKLFFKKYPFPPEKIIEGDE
jgi:hypothetical protein